MRKKTYTVEHLLIESRNQLIIYWDESPEGFNSYLLRKKLRAFAFLEKIPLPESDEALMKMQLDSYHNLDHEYKFIFYMNHGMTKDEINFALRDTAISRWENFALVDKEVFRERKSDIEKVLHPIIKARWNKWGKEDDFKSTWGFKKFW